MGKVYNFEVEMTCEGCSNQIKRILDRQLGGDIDKHNIDLEGKKVSVETSKLEQDAVQALLEKSGKKVTFISAQ